MKSKITTMLGVLLLFGMLSCEKDESGSDIGGSQSSIGEVGNEIEFGYVQGISNTQVFVSNLENGVSTFSCSANATDSKYIDLLDLVPDELIPGTVTISGNEVQADIKIKVTDEGGQLIFNDGTKLTLINYDAKVGDKYTATIGNTKLESEVIEKSTEDDYSWGGMYIKVIKVKAKSTVPGISNVILIYNHKFGLVGANVYFEDGSVKNISISC